MTWTRWMAILGLALFSPLAHAGEAASPAPSKETAARLAALRDPAESKRAAAAQALGEAGTEVAYAVLPLIASLRDESEAVRAAVKASLRAHGTRALRMVLRDLVSATSGGERGFAFMAGLLQSLGSRTTPTDVAAGLAAVSPEPSADPEVPPSLEQRQGLALALACVGRRSDSVDDDVEDAQFGWAAFLAATRDPDPTVRARATAALAIFGADAARRNPRDLWIATVADLDRTTLIRLLAPQPKPEKTDSSREFSPRHWPPPYLTHVSARSLLTRMPVGGDGLSDALARLAEVGQADNSALDALVSIDPAVAKRIATRRSGLTSATALVRAGGSSDAMAAMSSPGIARGAKADIALALAREGDRTAEVLDALVVGAVEGGLEARKEQFLRQIGAFGPERGKAAASRLEPLLDDAPLLDGIESLRDVAALALARLHPKGVDLLATWTAWKGSRKAGSGWERSEWLLSFTDAVRTTSDPARLAALLGGIHPGSDDRPELMEAAAAAVSMLGPSAVACVRPLVRRLEEVAEKVKKGDADAKELPTLLEMRLAGPGAHAVYRWRAAILEALATIGPAAAEAVPSVRPLTSNPDERIRVLAARTLRRIQK